MEGLSTQHQVGVSERWLEEVGSWPTQCSLLNGRGQILDLAGLRPPLPPGCHQDRISWEGPGAHNFIKNTDAGDVYVCVDPVALLEGEWVFTVLTGTGVKVAASAH